MVWWPVHEATIYPRLLQNFTSQQQQPGSISTRQSVLYLEIPSYPVKIGQILLAYFHSILHAMDRTTTRISTTNAPRLSTAPSSIKPRQLVHISPIFLLPLPLYPPIRLPIFFPPQDVAWLIFPDPNSHISTPSLHSYQPTSPI